MTSTSSIPKIKILFLGDSGVGKTALLRQFLEGKFARTNATVGFDIEFKVLEIQNRQVKLEIWDTAGQESYRAIIPSHYRRSKGVILVYDVTRPKTLENLQKWVEQLNLYCDPSPAMIVVGNKIDLLSTATESGQSVEALSQGQSFADSIGAFKHTNTSAKSGAGVKGVFEDLVRGIIFNDYMEKEENEATAGFRLDDPQDSGSEQEKSGGCRC
ncbi:hypothetical protein M407DRAFT_34955 [Tulasnella calospora MUT 4182]|uniref:Uncharacterized protein n=1 Tax=Tulasnella calospora MUT 4182 TaxID=1051891 RepID=A0A0C3PMB6_9AGAM|nr:hypothetical protein M407DRAFT_34955 [Tulasnella calospora MUT 4182]